MTNSKCDLKKKNTEINQQSLARKTNSVHLILNFLHQYLQYYV